MSEVISKAQENCKAGPRLLTRQHSLLPLVHPSVSILVKYWQNRTFRKLWNCSKSFREDQFKCEELQNWLISKRLGWVVACTSHELTEQLNLIIYVALLIKCLDGTECLWLLFRQRMIGVIKEKILLLGFFGRPSPHFYVPGGKREESTFWGSNHKTMI